MATFIKKILVVVAAVMAIMTSATAPVSAAGSPYDSYTYYEDGFVDQYGQFRTYDYDYYHKDGYRSDSYYGDIENYDSAYSRYRYVRDRAFYNNSYSAYYDGYEDYVRDFGTYYDYDYQDDWYVYRRGNDSSYNYDSYDYDYGYYNGTYAYSDYNYDYNDYYGDYYYGDSYYGSRQYNEYDYYGHQYSNAYFGCSRYDAECQYHRARDIDEDYTYIQYGPDEYVRSDYYDSYYANQRYNFLSSPYYRYY